MQSIGCCASIVLPMKNIINTTITYATPSNALAKLEREVGNQEIRYMIAAVEVEGQTRFAPVVIAGQNEIIDFMHLVHRGITVVA